MFAVIYRSYVLAEKEKRYQQAWHVVADFFVSHCGALGSCLHRAEDGLWVAYSRWPDKETRDQVWPGEGEINTHLPLAVKEAVLTLKSCVSPENSLPEIAMTVMDDLLLSEKN